MVERVVAHRRLGSDEPAQVARDQLARRVAHVPGGVARPAVGDDAGQLADVAQQRLDPGRVAEVERDAGQEQAVEDSP